MRGASMPSTAVVHKDNSNLASMLAQANVASPDNKTAGNSSVVDSKK